MRIVTIGVYGFDESHFFESVVAASIDLLVDTRRRRAVRGAKYAFANSVRLQQKLASLDIPYVHRLDLAPTITTLRTQNQADSDARIRRHDRETLTESFVSNYTSECLETLDSAELVASFGENIESLLLLCVEREPTACHRSLLAQKLASDLQDASIEHLLP